MEDAFVVLVDVWEKTKDIEVQKDFALAISGKTPFTGLLFDLRKRFAKEQSVELLKKNWREAGDLILKVLFKK